MEEIKTKLEYLDKKWRMLAIYNVYRLFAILVFVISFWFDSYPTNATIVYFSALAIYLLYGLLLISACKARRTQFETLIIWSGSIDIIVVAIFIHFIGLFQAGLGVILFIFVAMLSILSSGYLAIYFASVASCCLLIIAGVEFLQTNSKSLQLFFSSGIYGVGFFATALTALYLTKIVRSIEALAKEKGQELESVHKLNEYIVEKLLSGVIYVDAKENIKVINSHAKLLLANTNYKQKSLKGLSKPLYNKYKEFIQKRTRALCTGEAFMQEPNLRIKFYSPKAPSPTSVMILVEDMSQITQKAEELKLVSLEKFSATIAHEIRNPLAAIQSASELMKMDGGGDEEQKRLQELILTNCSRINNIIKNTLQISRKEKSKPQQINLVEFLEKFKEEYCSINTCEILIKAKQNMKVSFDKSQLDQILTILCDNALQHGRNAKNEVKISIYCENDRDVNKLFVCDEGIGIPETLHMQIFDPFFTSKQNGYGMGLYIARGLCELNGANIYIVSGGSCGSCFVINFKNNSEIKL